MKTTQEVTYECIEKYTNLIPHSSPSHSSCLPLVTLTYAQSLDGYIGKHGEQAILSCEDSFVFTHGLRACHDGILVGIGTIVSDNPSLTTRFVTSSHPRLQSKSLHPRPIILDPSLRIPLDSKVLKNNPIIFALKKNVSGESITRIQSRGALVLFVESSKENPAQIDLMSCLTTLWEQGIRSVMVEGGSKVISSFLSLRNQQIIDRVIVTVSPVIFGQGIKCCQLGNERDLKLIHAQQFDQDMILFFSTH